MCDRAFSKVLTSDTLVLSLPILFITWHLWSALTLSTSSRSPRAVRLSAGTVSISIRPITSRIFTPSFCSDAVGHSASSFSMTITLKLFTMPSLLKLTLICCLMAVVSICCLSEVPLRLIMRLELFSRLVSLSSIFCACALVAAIRQIMAMCINVFIDGDE